MSQREKILAALVAVLAVLGGAHWAATQVQDAFAQRKKRIEATQSKLQDQELKIALGAKAADALAAYEQRALPADTRLARSLYQTWLLEIADRRVGLTNVKISPLAASTRSKSGAYTAHSFNLTAQGDLRQLASLLYHFYSVDFLHRIKRVSVTPVRESKRLDLAVVIEALSLPGASNRDKLESTGPTRLSGTTLEEVSKPILERNLFAPPNQPPALASLSDQKAQVNRSWSLDLKASDPDKLDTVRYEVEAADLKGLSFDAANGKLVWTPSEPGSYRMTVRAWDDGLPAKSSEKTFEVVVNDPPPPPEPAKPPEPPKAARPVDLQFTYLTAVTESRGEREAWISVRTTGEMLKLREGDEFSIRGFEGTVRRIGENELIYEAHGKQYLVALGSHFDQSVEMSADEV